MQGTVCDWMRTHIQSQLWHAAAVLRSSACRLLKESVVLPLKYPQLFTGLLAPWRGKCLTAALHHHHRHGVCAWKTNHLLKHTAMTDAGMTA
jgi:hypothetical protein